MKINKSKSKYITKRKILWAVVSLTVILLITFWYLYTHRRLDSKVSTPGINSVNYDSPTNSQQQSGATIKSSSASSSNTSGSDQPSAPTSIPGSTQKSVSVTITAANQNGSTLQIRALIGAVANTGTCTLMLSQAGQQTVTKTAGTQALASTSTCQGFDIPTSDLSAAGTWRATITYNSDQLTGSATKDVVVQ